MQVCNRQKQFKVCAAFDTETTNIKQGDKWHAFTVCYQINDLRSVYLLKYEPDVSDDVRIYRHANEVLRYLDDLIAWGKQNNVIPIVAGYNLLFDLQTLRLALAGAYDCEVNAQSSTNVYTLDLIRDGEKVLRFWDTFHLEMNGLAAMGRAAGLKKLNGDWDYSLIRTPETPLTEDEIGYATRDVQVIPAFLKYLLQANPWMREVDLGLRVLTKTSIVRQMALHEIAPLRSHGRKLLDFFMMKCAGDLPRHYYDYGLRKACFRGGFTFTAARYASVVVRNVASLDVTSMHHTFINGSFMPEDFEPVKPWILRDVINKTLSTSVENVLKNYYRPFPFAYHVRARFYNLRLKKDSAFEQYGIALIPRGKFSKIYGSDAVFVENDAAKFAEDASRANGWRDRAQGAVFAFGKLYSADICELHVSEYELWCIGQVYDFDNVEPILGEGTAHMCRPADYVTLQSNILFERKQDMKKINKLYRAGTPYTEDIPGSIPSGIAAGLRSGELSNEFVAAYYGSSVKGMFNSVYGTQAQDVLKPDYAVDALANINVDADTVLSEDNFNDRLPDRCKVMYTYGLRIVGRSRMHLVIAIELLYRAFGERVRVTGGDTDSIKCSCDIDITDEMLNEALAPIADASKRAIDKTQDRVRSEFPRYASTLDKIGSFDIEECERGKTRWSWHMECWNKCRVSVGEDMHCHVTAAGLSRPAGMYHIENYIDDLLNEDSPENVLPAVMGYNVYVPADLAHSLQRTQPETYARFTGNVTDYTGARTEVDAPEAIALYPAGRWIGDTDMPSNYENVMYLARVYGRDVRQDLRSLNRDENGKPRIENDW